MATSVTPTALAKGDGRILDGILNRGLIANGSFVNNYSLHWSTASSNLTIALKDANGNDPSAHSPVSCMFKNVTNRATKCYNIPKNIEGALDIQVNGPGSSTLGYTNGNADYLYVYLVYQESGNSVQLGVSASMHDEGFFYATTDNLPSNASNQYELATTANLANVSIRCIGRFSFIDNNGTWDMNPTDFAYPPFHTPIQDRLVVATASGFGSGNTAIRYFNSTVDIHVGNAIGWTDSSTDGSSVAIRKEGIYHIAYADADVSSTAHHGITGFTPGAGASAAELDEVINTLVANQSTPGFEILCMTGTQANLPSLAEAIVHLKHNHTLYPHGDKTQDHTSSYLSITRMGSRE